MPLFERDRYQRLDGAGGGGPPGRKPWSFCSSATIVAFVAFYIVGAWMMASPSNTPAGVSEAKEKDVSDDVSFPQRVKGGGAGNNTTQTGGEDTPRIEADDGYGGDKDASAERTRGAGRGNGRGGAAGDGAVPEGETASRNQTFSDENGKMEGDEVARLEDPDTKVEQSAEEVATGGQGQPNKKADQGSEDAGGQADNNAQTDGTGGQGQPNKNADLGSEDAGGQADNNSKTDGTGDQVSKSDREESTTEANDDAGNRTDSVSQDQDTPTGVPKNQTTFDDANGKVVEPANEGGESAEKSPEDNDMVTTTTDDEAAAAGVAANNGISGEHSEAMAFVAAEDTTNGTSTMSQDMESATTTTNSSSNTAELLPSGQADLLNETASAKSTTFPTQAAESREERKKNKQNKKTTTYTWRLCNTTAGADYIPCLDNEAAIRRLKSTSHYEHRERHCPATPPTCLVPLPYGYRRPIPWPRSRDQVWYSNVPHTGLAQYKGHQNWVRVSGEHLTFPGGGTQFKNGGARHYVEVMQDALPEIAWGRRTRVVLDVGCGVASFGGYLFDWDAATVSFAPKDEHEAQVQLALERGIPAVSAVMGTLRLPFPGNAFDAVHCARCRVPWYADGGRLLLEAHWLLRPGGLFVWSATPVYRKVPEDVEIWRAMVKLTKSMCWEMLKRTSDTVDQTAMVVFKKPTSNACYDARPRSSDPPLCDAADYQDAAWNVTLRACVHRVTADASSERGARWPAPWPERLAAPPYRLSETQTGVYGRPAPADFAADQEHWRRVVNGSYLRGLGIDWKNVRNVMDMRAVYGGFAAALRDMKVWVMNVVPVDAPDTLPVIYDCGLFGMYHDWCESFSTYPRSYDLLHADHLFSTLKTRCGNTLLPAMAEVDRILRPDGTLIVRDDKGTVEEVKSIVKSLHWEVRMTVSTQGEELLCLRKTKWRPTQVETLS